MNDHAKSSDTTRSGTPVATACGILAIFFWSTTVACFRSVTEALGTIGAGAACFLLAGLVTTLPLAFDGRRRKALRGLPPAYWLACGGFFVLYIVSFHLAVGLARGHQEVLEVGLINYLWPSLTLLFSIPLLGRSVRWPLFPGLAIAGAGVALAVSSRGEVSLTSLVANWRANALAYSLALVGAIAWGLYNNASRRWGPRKSKVSAVPLFMLAAGAVLACLHPLFPAPWRLSWRIAAELLYVIVFPTILAYVFWEKGMREGMLVLLASLAYLTPVASTIFTCLRLGVTPGASLWIGCALVVTGAVCCNAGVSKGP